LDVLVGFGHLLRLGGRENVAQPIEAAFPHPASVRDPLLHGIEAADLETTGPDAADLFGHDDAAVFQDLEVLNDPRERHRHGSGQGANAGRTAAQALDDLPPGWIGERMEQQVEIR
jgi:hypothetical protein